MNDNLISDLDVLRLVIFALLSISIALLRCNRRMNVFFKCHSAWDSRLDLVCWLCLWCIGNEFMEWWLSGIIVLMVGFLFNFYLYKKFK